MIDQLPTAVPQALQSANTASRDRKQTSADKDEQGGSFEDIVSKAGQQQARQDQDEDGKIDLRPQAEAKERPVDIRPKAALELSAALRGFGPPVQTQSSVAMQNQMVTQSQAQMKVIANQAAKTADRTGQSAQQAEAVLAKLVEKLKVAAQDVEHAVQQGQQVSVDAQVDAEQALTPSDELGLLLGLSKEIDTKHGKKSAATEKADKKDEDDKSASVDKFASKFDVSHAEHVAAAMDAKHSSNSNASDDTSSRGDVVRLVSANGRGRAVDIEVPTVPGEAPRDTAKAAATTAKIDTATVLEARRYLGFTPEPNATALTTAIKADPTWTAALQAAERADLSTLGNTVTEVNTLKLQMNPENLGNMVASLKLKGEELTVELRVDSPEAYQQLSADHDDIVKSLQDQGFTIDKVTVQLNATDRTDTGADRNTARQDQPQRDGQDQQRDRENGQSGHNENWREQQRWTSGTLVDGAPVDNRTDAGRPDTIYL
jgi:hypothetical protein